MGFCTVTHQGLSPWNFLSDPQIASLFSSLYIYLPFVHLIQIFVDNVSNDVHILAQTTLPSHYDIFQMFLFSS